MHAILERIDPVVTHALRSAPDHHVAMPQRYALHRVAAVQAAPEVAVQRELGARPVAVDQIGIRLNPKWPAALAAACACAYSCSHAGMAGQDRPVSGSVAE